jgi:ATP-dependent DNA helicase RecQ
MPNECREFLDQCLLFDIEVSEANRIYSIGASFRGKTFLLPPGRKIGSQQLQDFAEFGAAATYILGHNILSHDIPRLRQIAPHLAILRKPAIDTLYLSPLAFPANPYHRLVKNYQIVRDSINDPAQDALLAGKVFAEQWQAFGDQLAAGGDAPLLYRGFLNRDADLTGTAAALGAMGIPLLAGDDLYDAFSWLAKKEGCRTAVDTIVDQLQDGTLAPAPLAYVTAWLTVAGSNSVLPPWVRHRFAQVPVILHQLRESPCKNPRCSYCREHHNPATMLQKYYGFAGFRPEPETAAGTSLQEAIVAAAARNTTIFATLPTGGGKSLCFLLPALMRYLRRNMLTIVISPLQALMKDQVDNFSRQTGTKIAAALSGMLTLPERGEVLEAVRLGDVGILYVSPEQLRNHSFTSTVGQREIGAWVFDEAHCLSKWGHDFRPDYLYSIRFIREFAQREKTAIPPVQCFTATAKRDVKAEIIDIIQSELGLRVVEFAGGHERTNLHYEVWPVEKYEKFQTILELLRARYRSGSVVIYCAKRKQTEKLAEFLKNEGYAVEAFHAGLEPSLKKRIQENFIDGTTPIICATNAFGMGIDKDDVRLVIHADIPGSLENYLQEAGRAGRDRDEAECILIFTEQDIEGQFRLSAMSRLSQRDIGQLLRGIRFASKGGDEVVMTAGELLRLDVVDIDPDELTDGDTRVRTAIAWLERAGYLERNENENRVFQGKPLVRDLEEAAAKIDGLNLSARQRERWLAILAAMMEKRYGSKGFSADELASLSPFAKAEDESDTETERVLRTLHDMADQGLLTKETILSAYVRYKVQNSSEKILQRVMALEGDFLKVLEETAPDVAVESSVELDLRQINQVLLDRGHEYSTPHSLKLILHGLSRDGKGLAGQRGSITVKAIGNNRFTLMLHRDWESLVKTVKVRQQAATIALQVIARGVGAETRANASLLVEFTLEAIVQGLKADLILFPQLKDPLAAAERALTFMHEQNVIDLQQGLAVFRQAMTLRLYPEAKGRRYSQADFAPLDTHYTERNFQIHVMNEYARRALDKLSAAMRLVSSYFNDEKEDFIRRFFAGKTKLLKRATSEQSWQRIVDDLNNDSQERIVGEKSEQNMLVLAGPGAGKTRVVAHRVAFLLRVKRIKPRSILVLCFNRSAVASLRRRLRELVGDDMNGVTTLTFHGLALRLTGRSLVTAARAGNADIDFCRVIRDAVKLLSGEKEVLGLGDGPVRDALIGTFSHILVDEYQDIDGEQYELVALLAGKNLDEKDRRMTILAVGDDDQNIYRFRGANVGFIRKFHADYEAAIHYLIENYRSTANIIGAANCLIAHNGDRMKTGHPIRINTARSELPAGGNWQIKDPVAGGRVQRLAVADQDDQAWVVLEEMRRLQLLESSFDLESCAVLAREWKDLDKVRAVLESAGTPVSFTWGRSDSFPRLTRIRENAMLLEYLRNNRQAMQSASSLLAFLPKKAGEDSVWQANLRRLIDDWREETGDTLQPVTAIEEYFYEALSDQNRAKNLGNGVFLSTVHSVKGLEFDHVFILGDWPVKEGAEAEEERRLYYVGMSRARQTLQLFTLQNSRNPHVALLAGDFLVNRQLRPAEKHQPLDRRYSFLGLEDMYLDFAGTKKEHHPVRQALRGLGAGDSVTAELRGGHIELVDGNGLSVARLSKAARDIWQGRLSSITAVRIVAMVRRYREDIADREYGERCHGDSWEVPVIEVLSSNI